MKPVVVQTLRSRWFAGCVHLGLWLLLYLAVTGLGGRTPDLRQGDLIQLQSPPAIAQLEQLFSANAWPKWVTNTNTLNPFLTRHFIPIQNPDAPPPTTRKIELTYQGFYETAGGPRIAVVKLGEAFLTAPLGAKLTANLFAAQATMQALTLTNPAAQTNLLLLNGKKELEVPIQ